MRKKFEIIKTFVHKHRAKIAVGATSVAFLWMMSKRADEWNEFLRKHNLYDEFYGEYAE